MNPYLRALGFGQDDRVAIIHADDIGMCHATIPILDDLFAGSVTSCALMVPCPWFAEAAVWAATNSSADVGVHLTLTSEWDRYRWGPLSTIDPASGLLDADGFFFRSTAEAQAHAAPEAVGVELERQVARALAAGVAPTHVDSHMGTVFHPELLPYYLAAGANIGAPAMVPRASESAKRMAPTDNTAAWSLTVTAELERAGLPLIDHIVGMPLDTVGDRVAIAKEILGDLPAGLSYVILHPAADTPELRAICDDAEARIADYHAFSGAAMRDMVRQSGVQTIGFGAIQRVLRQGLP